MTSGPITSWQIDGEKVETVTDFFFLGSQITANSACSHEIKRGLLLGRKAMTNLDRVLKSRDITLPKFHMKEETEQALSWKQDSILGWTVDFELSDPYLWKRHTNWETRPPEGRALGVFHHLKEYPNYLCNWVESYILLCLLGNDHKPIDNGPLLIT